MRYILIAVLAVTLQAETIWQQSQAGHSSFYVNGARVKVIDTEDLTISVLTTICNGRRAALVRIDNRSKDQRVDLVPSGFSLQIGDHDQHAENIDQLVAKQRRRNRARRMLIGGLGGAAASSPRAVGTVGGPEGAAVIVSRDDPQERAATDRAVREMRTKQAELEERMRAGNLLRSTVFPGASVGGWVYFDKPQKHGNSGVLKLLLGGEVYAFGVEW